MTAGVLLLLLIVSTAIGGPQDAAPKTTELEGAWEAEMMENDGQVNLPPSGTMRLTFRGSTVTLRGFLGRQDVDGTFTLDTAQKPKRLDITVPGKSGTTNIAAIYSIEASKLLFAFPRPKAQGPPSFERPVNADTVLITLRKLPS